MKKIGKVLLILIGVIAIILLLKWGYYLVIDKVSTKYVSQRSISGIYPQLAVFKDPDQVGGGETGIGAVVPWDGNLWFLTYSAHMPFGSGDKLYRVDEKMNLEVFEGSVGGTPANRMIHEESDQLLIGPYVIDKKGSVRVIEPQKMPGRLTANARHLTDPKNKVYYFTMEEGLYEVDVESLDVKEIYRDGNNRDPVDYQETGIQQILSGQPVGIINR